MRVVVQRVSSASVAVEGREVSRIGRGLLCLVGIQHGDTVQDAEFLSAKVLKAKAFENPDNQKSWNASVMDIGGEVLCVSQFTLYGRLKSNKPDFGQAMKPDTAKELYHKFLDLIGNQYSPEKVQDGVFGAMMDVSLVNDGPVTFVLESDKTIGVTI